MPKKSALARHVAILLLYLFIVWGVYRSIFVLPDEVEEYALKPIIWLLPVFYLVRQERAKLASLGISFQNLPKAVAFAVGLGLIFMFEGILLNAQSKGVSWGSVSDMLNKLAFSAGISIATGLSEEITFRGYVFSRLLFISKNEWSANILSSLFWTVLHLPLALFVWKLPGPTAAAYLGVVMLFGMGSAFIFARTKNIASSVLLHIFWEWPLILF